MSYLGGSIAYLWNQFQLWKGRANNAWGSSRVWNSGTSFETDVSTWTGRANQAYDSGVWGTGNLWSTDAHSDPNVYTNRFNDGYNSVVPPAAVDHKAAAAAIPNGSDGFSGGNLAGVTADKTGQWIAVARADVHGPASGVQIYNAAGTLLAGSGSYFWHLDSSGAVVGSPQAGVFWQGTLNNGDTIYVRAATASFGGGSAYIDMWFIPTSANPH